MRTVSPPAALAMDGVWGLSQVTSWTFQELYHQSNIPLQAGSALDDCLISLYQGLVIR